MSRNQNNLFKSTEEQSITKFAQGPGECFFVPTYQRYFVWQESDVRELFEDMVNGLKSNISNLDYVTFIGTITGFKDHEYQLIEPQLSQDAPESIINIVDGQQRLTALIIGAIFFHNNLRVAEKNCKSKWLSGRVAQRLKELACIYEIVRETGEEQCYYPKMIRASVDAWTIDECKKRYHSPLSHLIHLYGNHTRQVKAKDFKFTSPIFELSADQKKIHDKFKRKANLVNRIIKKYCSNKLEIESEELLPDFFTKNLDNLYVINSICNQERWPDNNDVDFEDEGDKQIIIALLLSSYFLNRIRFVALISYDENQSFDIFEKLNTTGQILTSIETFKPEVILDFDKDDDKVNYIDSDAKKYFDEIDKYIGTLNPGSESKVSKEMVVNFALAENGTKLPANINSQRSFLRNYYPNNGKFAVKNKHDFLHHLRSVSQTQQYFWDDSASNIMLLKPYREALCNNTKSKELSYELNVVQLCLKYLKAANHIIARSIIARFHDNVILNQNAADSEKHEHIKELFRVIKAASAFFAIWRSTHLTTDFIYVWHEDLHRFGIQNEYDDYICQPTSRLHFRSDYNEKGTPNPKLSSTNVIKAFRHIIKTNDKGGKTRSVNKGQFTQHAYKIPISRTQRATAKLLLLLAAHNSTPSKKRPGYYEDGRDNNYNLLISDAWENHDFDSIDYVIPKTAANNDIPAQSEDILSRLGNLTLLPKEVFSAMKGLSWKQRKMIYLSLSGVEVSDLELKKAGVRAALIKKIIEIAKDSLIVKRIAGMETFDFKNIDPLGKHLAGRAWDILYEDWLKE